MQKRLIKTSSTKTLKTARVTVLAAILATTLGATLSTHANASEFGHGSRTQHSFTHYARVVNVEPIYRQVAYDKPREECWVEEQRNTRVYNNRTHSRDHNNRRNTQRHNSGHGHNTGQALIGGLIGGVIGNQLGHHTGSRQGRVGATVAGAIIGSAIANESPKRHRRQSYSSRHRAQVIETTPVRRCTTKIETHYEQALKGYNVTYKYHGKRYTTRMKRHPGDRIPLQISIQPGRG